MRISLRLIAILGWVLLFLPFLMFWSKQSQQMPVGSLISERFDPNTLAQGLEYTHFLSQGENAQKLYTVRSSQLVLEDGHWGPFAFAFYKNLVMVKPEITFYKDNADQAILTGYWGYPQNSVMKGQMDFMNADEITIKEHAVLAVRNGRVLSCESLKWNKSQGLIRGQGHCTLVVEKESVRANNITVDSMIDHWVIEQAASEKETKS